MSGISWLNKGVLSIITGPMFSGKTEELIRRINVLKRANKNVLVFKSILDTRYTFEKLIISHNLNKIECFTISKPSEILEILRLHPKTEAIGIDEIQFLSLSFFPIIKDLIRKKNITVICCGLDKDYFNQYTSLLTHLMVIADVIDKYFSICIKCNEIAIHSQRIDENKKEIDYNEPEILISGIKNYEARCKKHFIEFDKNRKYE